MAGTFQDQLATVQHELGLFCEGKHPAYDGKNKTQKPPLMDGQKGSRRGARRARELGRSFLAHESEDGGVQTLRAVGERSPGASKTLVSIARYAVCSPGEKVSDGSRRARYMTRESHLRAPSGASELRGPDPLS